MWPLDRIRKPSPLRELLMLLRSMHASQQETNLLLRELLTRHGVQSRTPSAPPWIQWQSPTSSSGNHPSPSGWTGGQWTPTESKRDTRKRTNRDVTTSHEIPSMSTPLTQQFPNPTDRLMTEQELEAQYLASLGPEPHDE